MILPYKEQYIMFLLLLTEFCEANIGTLKQLIEQCAPDE